MSVDLTTNLGPYVACSVPLVTMHESRECCSTVNCPAFGKPKSGRYCPQCGNLISMVTFPQSHFAVAEHEVRQAIDEALYLVPGDEFDDWMRANSVHLWLSNRRDSTRLRNWSFYPGEGIEQAEITPALIADEIAAFEHQYADVLPILRRFYGEGNVRVCWGLNH